jgi:2-oxoisovalerate dehydrogenase E1 component alpha subunit
LLAPLPPGTDVCRFRKWLEAQNWWSADEETALRTQVRKDVLRAFAKAEKESKPAVKDIFSDMFKEPTEELKEQRAELRRILELYPDEYDLGEFDGGKAGI